MFACETVDSPLLLLEDGLHLQIKHMFLQLQYLVWCKSVKRQMNRIQDVAEQAVLQSLDIIQYSASLGD